MMIKTTVFDTGGVLIRTAVIRAENAMVMIDGQKRSGIEMLAYGEGPWQVKEI